MTILPCCHHVLNRLETLGHVRCSIRLIASVRVESRVVHVAAVTSGFLEKYAVDGANEDAGLIFGEDRSLRLPV